MDVPTAENQDADVELTDQNADIHAQMDVLWTENRAMLLERVDMLERECLRWLRMPDDRAAGVIARNLAHRLTSVLGAFDMKQGSAVASSIERMVSSSRQAAGPDGITMYALLSELREIVRSKS